MAICQHRHKLRQFFMKLSTGDNSIKVFLVFLCHWQHNPCQNLRPYANIGINYAKKTFMKLATSDKFIKVFLVYFTPLAAKSMSKLGDICQQRHKLCKKTFMKLSTGDNSIKVFLVFLCHWQHNPCQNLRPYANIGINYAKKPL
jgi:outer membrane protein W